VLFGPHTWSFRQQLGPHSFGRSDGLQTQPSLRVHVWSAPHAGAHTGAGSTQVLFGPHVWSSRQQLGPHSLGRPATVQVQTLVDVHDWPVPHAGVHVGGGSVHALLGPHT
jgi:hypothetical protein